MTSMRKRRLSAYTSSFVLVVLAAGMFTGCGTGNETKPLAQADVDTKKTLAAIDVKPGDPTLKGTEEEARALGLIDSTSSTDGGETRIEVREDSTLPTLVNDPEKKQSSEPSGMFPERFVVPSGATLIKAASRLDDADSFIALQLEGPWVEATTILKTSLQETGWNCERCVPYNPGLRATSATANFKYLMQMIRADEHLFVIIEQSGSGKVTASLTFRS